MYALALKLRSQVKSKGYVELKKKKKILEIKQSMCWIQSDDAEACVIHRKHPRVFSVLYKAFLVSVFPKGSKHTHTTSLCQWRNAHEVLHSFPHAIFIHFSNKKWHIEYVFLEIPEIHSLGFQLVSHPPPLPRSQPQQTPVPGPSAV